MKYKTIVIDPPWKLHPVSPKTLSGGKFNQVLPYEQMTDEQIINFPINDFADTDCDLFIWTTHGKLPIALECLKNWGFKYHILLTWNKTNGISINGFQRKTELVVYGYRGKMRILKTKGHYIPTLFTEVSTTHSTKPKVFYKLLVERTAEPRIDIFARKRHFGFDAYGDQVEPEMEVQLIPSVDAKSTE